MVRIDLDTLGRIRFSPEALARLDAIKDEDIDYSDIRELDATWFAQARTGEAATGRLTLVRLDADVLAYVDAAGGDRDALINCALRHYILAATRQPDPVK